MSARFFAVYDLQTGKVIRTGSITPHPEIDLVAAQAMPGEDPMTLETPEQVAGRIVELCLPSFTESGKVYAYPVKRLLTFRSPD